MKVTTAAWRWLAHLGVGLFILALTGVGTVQANTPVLPLTIQNYQLPTRTGFTASLGSSPTLGICIVVTPTSTTAQETNTASMEIEGSVSELARAVVTRCGTTCRFTVLTTTSAAVGLHSKHG